MEQTLKLIAIRILPNCASHIRKCLSENTFYYLCNDYTISDDGGSISRSSQYVEPLSDSFFNINGGKNSVCINLQAIVGKNGDGKSSLIEVMIRLLNNLSYQYDLNPNNQLLYIKDLRAEFYFKYGAKFYCISESTNSEDNDASEVSAYRYSANGAGIIKKGKKLNADELKEIVFYSLVSNYSHYSYNTEEFDKEWREGHITSNESDCWLQRVFHKNDGYQSPLGLHPYRCYGNIDINRERHLSKSRLSTILLSNDYSEEGTNSYWGLEDKHFLGLRLADVGYSKLQEYTIKQFFIDYKHVNLLESQITLMKDCLAKKDSELSKEDLKSITELANAIRKTAIKYFREDYRQNGSRNSSFFYRMHGYAKTHKLLAENSDLRRLIKLVKATSKHPKLHEIFRSCAKEVKVWEKYKDFSLAQIQRIELIDDICDQWRCPGILPMAGSAISIDVSPEVITKAYSKLSAVEKCYHYIIYKTISIFETYQEYKYPCKKYAETALYFDAGTAGFTPITMPNGFSITEPFSILSMDWAGHSHLTIKLQQTYNYCMGLENNTQALYAVKNKDVVVAKSELLRLNGGRQLQIHQLPPAIYDWDLVFETQRNGETILFDGFSSGEKQKMNCLAAIVYHVRNVSSITEATIKYKSINLVLEEIELYFHPEWQRRFSYDLMGLLRTMDLGRIESVNVLFVTHSPYILSDIPRANVLFLKQGKPEYWMQENTFGANINSLLKNGFFLPSLPMGEFAHQKINNLFGKLHSGNFDIDRIQELKSEILMVGEPYIRQQLMSLLKMHV